MQDEKGSSSSGALIVSGRKMTTATTETASHEAGTILMISSRCPTAVTLETATLYTGAPMCRTTTSSPVR